MEIVTRFSIRSDTDLGTRNHTGNYIKSGIRIWVPETQKGNLNRKFHIQSREK